MAEIIKTREGRVIIRCPSCGYFRAHTSFLLGSDPKKKDNWAKSCEYCRRPNLAEAVGKPADADWDDDSSTPCVCKGTGKYETETPYGVFRNICFRCKGKGWLSWRDLARNWAYDRAHK